MGMVKTGEPSHTARFGRGRTTVRICKVSVTAAVTLLTIVGVPATARAQTSLGSFIFTGDAYGTSAKVAGGVVTSGPTALVTLGCTDSGGIHRTNSVATVSAPPLANTGTVTTTATTENRPALAQSQTTAATQTVNLLNGAVTADAVNAVSTTSADASGFHTSGAGSTLANLVIGGNVISATPPPNTRISLLGLGTVVLNEQRASMSASGAKLTVNMIHVTITVANPIAAIGTQIIVSHATSDLEGPTMGAVDGRAYGTKANVDGVVRSGETALVIVPCQGTNGDVITNTTAGVDLSGVGTTGTITDTAQATVTPTSEDSKTTSTVQAVNLLSGLVTADAVTAVAHASSSGTPVFSDAGSTFANLTVSGVPILAINIPANTQIPLAGLGTLYLHRVIQTGNHIEVRMIELVVSVPTNTFGLPVGLDLRIAVAEASVH